MIVVYVKNDNFEVALRKFKKLVKKEHIIEQVRDNQEYVKPSEEKRLEYKRQVNLQKKKQKKTT